MTRTLALAGLLLAAACQGDRPPDRAPAGRTPGLRGVVLISIDTLRADHLGCYGYHRDTSPFLDELAAGGTLFQEAITSAPWTLPAHASLLSGLYPSTHRAVDGSEAMADTVPLAAELFQEAGYATGGFVASWFVSRRYGFQRGFQRFDDFDQTLQENTKDKIPAVTVVDAAASWLREAGTRPFLLFVHLYDAHFNYAPPPEHAALFDTGYRGPRPPYRKYSYYFDNPLPEDLLAFELAMYDGEIHYVDAQLRRLYGVLEEMGIARDVLVLVTSDHGEEFFERGSWGHAHTLYDELMRVPLIFAGGGVAPGRRHALQVRHVDVLPTLLEAAGLKGPPGLPGRSLWPLLTGGEEEREAGAVPRPAFMETSRFDSNLIGVRRDGWKAILDLQEEARHLYHVAADPGEIRDLRGSEAERAEALQAETLSAAAALVPDRWLLRWFGQGDGSLTGVVETDGAFVMARPRGVGGEVRLQAGAGELAYELPPGGVLEMVVLPVDAKVTVRPPSSGGKPMAIALGREGRPAPAGPVTASAHDAEVVTGIPTPVPPAVAFWLEQSRGGGAVVTLTEDEIRRLESLGYVMR